MSAIREPPIAQVPQIASPDALHSPAVGQLSKDRINAIAHAAQYRAPPVCRLPAFRAYERKPGQCRPCATRLALPAANSCGHPRASRSCLRSPKRRSRLHAALPGARYIWVITPGQHSRMCRRKPENVWRQVWSQPVLAVSSCATAARGAGKLTDRDGLTHHDGHHGIREQQAIPDEAPQPLFAGPQVGCLPDIGRAIHSREPREKVR